MFYSHGATKFCGAAFAFLGSKVLEVVGTKNNRGRIFIFDIKICDKELILVNNEKHWKRVDRYSLKPSGILNSIPNIMNKNAILGGAFNLFFNTLLQA